MQAESRLQAPAVHISYCLILSLENSMITQEELKNLLHYDPQTGFFTRIKCTNHQHKLGENVSKHDGHGYFNISIKGKRYFAHRLAFLYMTGDIPKVIDHISQIGTDNRWVNLRPIDKVGNGRNTKIKKNNKSGFTGVTWDKDRNKWFASICVNGKSIGLGRYKNKNDAVKARRKANIKYGFHSNHGKVA